MNTDIAQQIMKVVNRSFQSFFRLLKAVKSGSFSRKVQIPKYLPKNEYFVLILPRIDLKEGGYFKVPMSKEFEKQFGLVRLQFPNRLKDKTIKEVRIHPRYNAQFFEVEYVYKQSCEPKTVNANIALAIDFGVDNLATCTTSTGTSFIIDGLKLKSINQWYNKENARLQSIKDLQSSMGLLIAKRG